jgi:electron transport complex protein RnfC
MSKAVSEFGDTSITVMAIPTRYPTGGEKQLIYTVTGKEVPKNGLPVHIGIVCQNIATVVAIYRAVRHGEPLVSRYITVTGDVAQPRNFEVLFGTPIRDLLAQAGGVNGSLRRLLIGGPMMGFAMHSDAVPVIKTTNCLLVDAQNTKSDLTQRQYAMPCIRCGKCAEVCPVHLQPHQLYWHAKAQDIDELQAYSLFDCIECGCCDYVCPSQIPLVQYYRFAKGEIWSRQREKQKSDVARDRFEYRQHRLEREKAERAEKHKKKKLELDMPNVGTTVSDGAASEANSNVPDAKKAAILAALERAQAKKTQQNMVPKNVDNLTDAQKQMIAEVDARRTQQRQAEHVANAEQPK